MISYHTWTCWCPHCGDTVESLGIIQAVSWLSRHKQGVWFREAEYKLSVQSLFDQAEQAVTGAA
jgi:hypothetical protein